MGVILEFVTPRIFRFMLLFLNSKGISENLIIATWENIDKKITPQFLGFSSSSKSLLYASSEILQFSKLISCYRWSKILFVGGRGVYHTVIFLFRYFLKQEWFAHNVKVSPFWKDLYKTVRIY